MGEECGLRTLALVKYLCEEQGGCLVELETNLREVCSFTILVESIYTVVQVCR